MADYEIFREQLAIKYPSYGYALWEPSPRNPNRPVQIGDVGFIREGRFYRLFNALLPADNPSQELGVPEDHKPLVPTLSDHVATVPLGRNNYCSAGVMVEADPGYHSSPDDFPQVLFRNETTRTAAVLSLPVIARRENTLIRNTLGRWMVRHIDTWFAFARNFGLVHQMEEIILVTGCDLTRSWTNIAFLGGCADARVSFGVKVEAPNTSINFQFSPESGRGAVLQHGPEGTNLPENQCVFIRGFRVAPSLWILPKRLKAAAGPSPDPGGYGSDSDMEVISIPAISQFRDPLHLLSDYIAEQASDCDKILIHDDDLLMIDGITLLETLEPDILVDLFRKSNIKIHKFGCDSFLTESQSEPNTDTSNVKVATLSMTFQNWNPTPPSQSPPLAAQKIDLSHTSAPRDQPGMPMGYGTSRWQASQQPPIGPSPRSEYDPSWPFPLPGFSFPPGVVHQQSPRPMGASWSPSQDSAGAHNGPWGGSYSPQSANESYFPYNSGGFVGQQNPPHTPPPRSQFQGSASYWDTMAGSYSHPGQSANGSYSPPVGFFCEQNPRPMTAAPPYQGPAGVQDPLGPYPWSDRTTIAKKRKGLIIGINYSRHPDPRFKLKCCIEDAHNMAGFLCANLRFAASDIRLMTDETTTSSWDYPTKANILEAMRELVRNAQPQDSFFVYFSGHGVQIDDLNGDEPDGLAECICAMDYFGNPYQNADTPGLIVNDIMHEIMVKPLPPQCHLTAIFDSCHSGTVLDLPHIYRSDGVVVKEFRHPYRLEVLRQKESKAVAISLSASKDNQKARETHLGGALRRAFIDSMSMSNNTLTYKELIQSVREYMRRNKFRHRPQLSSSHKIDINLQFHPSLNSYYHHPPFQGLGTLSESAPLEGSSPLKTVGTHPGLLPTTPSSSSLRRQSPPNAVFASSVVGQPTAQSVVDNHPLPPANIPEAFGVQLVQTKMLR